jgi:hypothetical protein
LGLPFQQKGAARGARATDSLRRAHAGVGNATALRDLPVDTMRDSDGDDHPGDAVAAIIIRASDLGFAAS